MKSGYLMLLIVSATFLRASGRPSNHKRVVPYGEKLLSTVDPSMITATTSPSVEINTEPADISGTNRGVNDSSSGNDPSLPLDNLDTQQYEYDYDYLSYLYDTDYFDLINETLFEATKNMSDSVSQDDITIVNITLSAPQEAQHVTTEGDTETGERTKLNTPSKIIVSRLWPFRYTTVVPAPGNKTVEQQMSTGNNSSVNGSISFSHRFSPATGGRESKGSHSNVSESKTKEGSLRKNIPIYPRGRRISPKVHVPQLVSAEKGTQKNATANRSPKRNLMWLRFASLHKRPSTRKQTNTRNKPRLSQKEKRRKVSINNKRINKPKFSSTIETLRKNSSSSANNVVEEMVVNTHKNASIIKSPKIITFKENILKLSAKAENITAVVSSNLDNRTSSSSTFDLVDKSASFPLHERIRKELNSPLPKPLPEDPTSITVQPGAQETVHTSPKIVVEKIARSETGIEEPVISSPERLPPIAKKLISHSRAQTGARSIFAVAKVASRNKISASDKPAEEKPITIHSEAHNRNLTSASAEPMELKSIGASHDAVQKENISKTSESVGIELTSASPELNKKESTLSLPEQDGKESASPSPPLVGTGLDSPTPELANTPANATKSRHLNSQEKPRQNHTTKINALPVPNFASQLGANPQGTNPRGTSPFGSAPQGVSPFGPSPGGNVPKGVSSKRPVQRNDTSETNTTTVEAPIDVKEERFHVQIKKPDGSINGNYVVLDHLTGDFNGVRYDAVDGADQQLIQKALLSFLSLDPRLDPRPKGVDSL